MRQLHPEAIAAIQSKVLFSKAEEQLLTKVGSVRAGRMSQVLKGGSWVSPGATTCPLSTLQSSQPTLDTFQELLHKHPDVFYPARTAKALQLHWQLMKQYYLLDDQTGETPVSPVCPVAPVTSVPSASPTAPPPPHCSFQCSRCPRATKC